MRKQYWGSSGSGVWEGNRWSLTPGGTGHHRADIFPRQCHFWLPCPLQWGWSFFIWVDVCATVTIQLSLHKSLHFPFRQKMWRGAGRFHWIHWIPKLPRQLPSQHRVYMDHQPTPQASHLDCGPWDLPACRGWLRGLPGDEKNLCVAPLCLPPLLWPAGKTDSVTSHFNC